MFKTIIVLGNFRGGTSAVAGILRLLGIPMGKRFDPANNHEDLDFQAKDVETINRLIQERNKEFDVWGWKDPMTIQNIDKLKNLRNPQFIVVFRDPYAKALSEQKYNNWTIEQGLKQAREYNSLLIDFALTHKCFLISYEKLLVYPEQEIKRLADFLGVDFKKEIVNFIQPGKYVKI